MEVWKRSLKSLQKICIRRCIKPEGFGITKEGSLHHFSDTSEESYGQPTYLRLVNVSEEIHYSLNGKIKSSTKEICDHTTSGIGSCCVISEDRF